MCQYFPSDLGKYDAKTGSEREIKSLYEKKLFWGKIRPILRQKWSFSGQIWSKMVNLASKLVKNGQFRVEISPKMFISGSKWVKNGHFWNQIGQKLNFCSEISQKRPFSGKSW